MDFLVCKICDVPYDEEEHRPRHAPCGHELCSACIKALITESIFQCPKCRQKNKVDVPADLPVSFGLIDVIRAFKNKNISMIQETEPKTSGAKNGDLCKVHHEAISHRCIKCEIWICDKCLDSHSKVTGCSTVNSSTAVDNLKKKCTNDMKAVLVVYDRDVKDTSTKIKENTEQKSEHLKMAAEYDKEIKKFRHLLKQGEMYKNNLIKSRNQLSTTHSPYAVMDKIEMVTQMKQSLHSWTIRNLGIDPSSKSIISGATNDDLCKVHHKPISHRCMKCDIWICDECLGSHSKITECSSVNVSTAVENLKKTCTGSIDLLLDNFDRDIKVMSTKIQEHTEQRNELLQISAKHESELKRIEAWLEQLKEMWKEEDKGNFYHNDDNNKMAMKTIEHFEQRNKHQKFAARHDEELKKIQELLKQGKMCKDSLVKSKNQLCTTHSPYAVMDQIEIVTQMKQTLINWFVENLDIYTASGLLKALKEGNSVYVGMDFKGEKIHGKLSKQGECTIIHSFHKRAVVDDNICIPVGWFGPIQKIIPQDVSLAFLELSLGGNVVGKVLIRLDKGQPTIRKHFVKLVTGEMGRILIGTKMYDKTKHDLFTDHIDSEDFPLTPNRKGRSTASEAKRGDVLSYFGRGYFEQIFFYIDYLPSSNFCGHYAQTAHIFGNVEEGMGVLQECHDGIIKGTRDVIISDCGIIIE